MKTIKKQKQKTEKQKQIHVLKKKTRQRLLTGEKRLFKNIKFYIFFDYFFPDSSIAFKDAGDPPMLTGRLPDPQTPPNPQKSIFPGGGLSRTSLKADCNLRICDLGLPGPKSHNQNM